MGGSEDGTFNSKLPRLRQRATKRSNAVVSVLSVSSAIAVFNVTWKLRDDVEKIVDAKIVVFKPNNDVIRSVCKELVDNEKDRAKEAERELREGIEFNRRYIFKRQ
jgi:fructose-1-phosphate kinase PfkB-like protein